MTARCFIFLFSAVLGAAAPGVSAGERTCTLLSRVCAETDAAGECTRYDSKYRCVTPADDPDRCEPDALSPAKSTAGRCTVSSSACSASEDGLCLETLTNLLCPFAPSGEGITTGEPRVSIAYETSAEPDQAMPDGCRITADTCLQSGERVIEVENVPGLTATTSACWSREYTVSCPSADAASSCQTLAAAGCEPTGTPVCEATQDGVCIRWSNTYRCSGTEVTGPDISTDGSETTPGDVTEDTAACDAIVKESAAAGLTCVTDAKVCAEASDDASLPCKTYQASLTCSAPASDTCPSLRSLADSGACVMTGEPVCTKTAEDGTCLIQTARYLCSEAVSKDDAAPAVLESTQTLPDFTPSDDCIPAAGRGSSPAALFSRARTPKASDAGLAGCIKTASVCTEGPGYRFLNGRPEYRDCWAETETWTCQSAAGEESDCAKLESDKRCRLVSETCPTDSAAEDGTCLRPERVYECTTPGTDQVIGESCDGEVCLAGICRPTDGDASQNASDFVNSLVQLEIGRQAGLYGNAAANEFFGGMKSTCRDRKGAASCCRAETVSSTSNSAFGQLLQFGLGAGTDYIQYLGSPYVYDLLAWSDSTGPLLTALYGKGGPQGFSTAFNYWGVTASYSSGAWSFSFSPASFLAAAAVQFYGRYSSCEAGDQRTNMAKGQRLCHYVGTTCGKRVAGLGCVETIENHVCFNSRLARIIHEEGRPQLGRGWGTPEYPDASGFTIEELQKLDFSKMDLSEFTADVIREAAAYGDLAEEEAAARAAERIAAMVSGELSLTAPVSGIQGTSAASNQPTDPSGTGRSVRATRLPSADSSGVK